MKRSKSNSGGFEQTARLARKCGAIRGGTAGTTLQELEAEAGREDLSRSQRRYLSRLIRQHKGKKPSTTPKG